MARGDRGARGRQIGGDALDPRAVERRRARGVRHRGGRADRLGPGRRDGDDEAHVPARVGPSGSARATASLPSGRSPRAISTKPPKIERAAEPEPTRASADSSDGDSVRPAARVAATASAANPDADDARPAAVGTLCQLRDLQSLGRSTRIALEVGNRALGVYVILLSSQPFLNTGFTYLFASLLLVNSIFFASQSSLPSTRVATAPSTIHSV